MAANSQTCAAYAVQGGIWWDEPLGSDLTWHKHLTRWGDPQGEMALGALCFTVKSFTFHIPAASPCGERLPMLR